MKKRSAVYSFSADEAATFRCSVDGGAAQPCTSPLTLKRLKKGKHSLSVVATDAAGNVDASPATDTFKVVRKKRGR